MIKFIIFFGALLYLLSRFSTQIFRFAVWLLGKQIEKEVKKQHAKASGVNVKEFGGVQIIYHNQQKKNNPSSQTGNYVDYEEVTDK
jgi:hypothetical protein